MHCRLVERVSCSFEQSQGIGRCLRGILAVEGVLEAPLKSAAGGRLGRLAFTAQHVNHEAPCQSRWGDSLVCTPARWYVTERFLVNVLRRTHEKVGAGAGLLYLPRVTEGSPNTVQAGASLAS